MDLLKRLIVLLVIVNLIGVVVIGLVKLFSVLANPVG